MRKIDIKFNWNSIEYIVTLFVPLYSFHYRTRAITNGHFTDDSWKLWISNYKEKTAMNRPTVVYASLEIHNFQLSPIKMSIDNCSCVVYCLLLRLLIRLFVCYLFNVYFDPETFIFFLFIYCYFQNWAELQFFHGCTHTHTHELWSLITFVFTQRSSIRMIVQFSCICHVGTLCDNGRLDCLAR